jgi:hypothetical protein
MNENVKIIVSLSFVLLTSCSAQERQQPTSEAFMTGEKLAELKNKDLKEISGIAASVANPKHLWAHNDAGNKAEIYLLDEGLNVKMTCKLSGIENRDWEDIAVGPGPDPNKSYVYVGDIGDNDAEHRDKYVYRIVEPELNKNGADAIISNFDKIVFRLDGAIKDTETLLLDPKTKNLYVVTKRENPVYLYELRYPYDKELNTAQKMFALSMTRIVGGDFSSDGKEILLKNDGSVFYWTGSSAESVIEKMKTAPALTVPYEKEPQGEAIAWASDGSGFYTLSEMPKNKNVFLYFYKRK